MLDADYVAGLLREMERRIAILEKRKGGSGGGGTAKEIITDVQSKSTNSSVFSFNSFSITPGKDYWAIISFVFAGNPNNSSRFVYYLKLLTNTGANALTTPDQNVRIAIPQSGQIYLSQAVCGRVSGLSSVTPDFSCENGTTLNGTVIARSTLFEL
jgi:hypothetical protein